MTREIISRLVSFSEFSAFGLSTVVVPSLILYYHFSHPRSVSFPDSSRSIHRGANIRHKFFYTMAGFVSAFYCLIYFSIVRALVSSGVLQGHDNLQNLMVQFETVEFWALGAALFWVVSAYVIVLLNINVSSGKRRFISTYLGVFLVLSVIPTPDGKSALEHVTGAYSELNFFNPQELTDVEKAVDAGSKTDPDVVEKERNPDSGNKTGEEESSAPRTLAGTTRFLFITMLVYVVLKYFTDIFFERQKESKAPGVDAFDLSAVLKVVEYFLWLLGAMTAAWFVGVELLSLGLFSGLIGAALTMAFRDLLNNMFSGLFLHWDNSIQTNAVIRTHDGIVGEVKKISLRYTFLSTPDNVDILIPNSSLVSNRFENFTRTGSEVRLRLQFEVAQSADILEVRQFAEEACMAVPEVAAAAGRPPAVFYLGANRGAHEFDLRFWVNNPRPGPAKLRSLVAYEIFKKFKEEKVPLPLYRIESTPFDITGS